MLEFRVARKGMPTFIQNKTTWENKTANAVRQVRQQAAAEAEKNGTPKPTYPLNFQNMFLNINNTKPGCRSCRGTF
jgi:hypothetical protein